MTAKDEIVCIVTTFDGKTLLTTTKSEKLLTVAVASKWYCLYLVTCQGIEVVTFDELEEDANALGLVPYVDHVPNPEVVEKFAARLDYDLDDVGFEIMVGRWEVEVENHYSVAKADRVLVRELKEG